MKRGRRDQYHRARLILAARSGAQTREARAGAILEAEHQIILEARARSGL